MTHSSSTRGFTLIELMVSVTLFVVVMLVAVGALLSLVDANRKARALESVMNNLNIAVDSMVRSIRMGNTFNCGTPGIPTGPADCGGGGTTFSFAPFGADPDEGGERWVYFFEENRLWRSRTGSKSNAVAITAPEVKIDDMQFYVVGTARDTNGDGVTDDATQPKVVMVIKGTAGAEGTKSETSFYIQATAVQRVLDL